MSSSENAKNTSGSSWVYVALGLVVVGGAVAYFLTKKKPTVSAETSESCEC